jgi:hypothetical protein
MRDVPWVPRVAHSPVRTRRSAFWDLGQIFKSDTTVLCSPPPRRRLAPPVVVEPDRHSLAAVVPGPAAPLRAIGAPRARAPVPASAAAVEPSPSRRAVVPGPAAPPQATVASSTAAVGELSPFLISHCSYPTYGCTRARNIFHGHT